MSKRNSILLAFVFLLLVACSRYPKEVLEPQDMVDVLYDIQLAQSVYNKNSSAFGSNENKDRLVNYVLEKHGVTQAELDSSLAWYSDNPDLYVKVHEKVAVRFTEKRDEYDKIVRSMNRSGRSDQLVIPFFYFTKEDPLLRFQLDSAKVESMGHDVVFSFRTLGVTSNAKLSGNVCFEFPDTTLCVEKKIISNVSYKFEKPYHPLGLVRVWGYVSSDIEKSNHSVLLYDMKIEERKE